MLEKTPKSRSSAPMNQFQKELSRPPIYNPEDYALSLKKWTSKPIVNANEQNETTVQSSCAEREMSLRQFSSISDLLNKLKTDLRLAYISFVQEFVADPIDGITLLLELLRSIQANDSNQHTKATSALHRRSLLDENSCLQCLRYSLRCPETTRRLAMAPTGLFSLTVCIMSSVSKSRIIALELLTKICCYSIAGHNAVSEAMSTMRLRFGESVRFRFLVSMLNGAAADLLLSGLRFINTFLETSPKKQTHLYIQAEIEQAGFSVKTLKDMMPAKNSDNEAILEELNRWSKLYIDVEVLKNNHNNKCKEVSALKEKILELESQIKVLQNEKKSLSENCYKERSSKMNISTSDSCSNSIDKTFAFKTHINYPKQGGENSTPAEDEGISSSDHDDLEENVHHQNNLNTYVYGEQNNNVSHIKYKYNYDRTSTDPSIDEVMKGFQNLINEVKNHHNSQDNLKKLKQGRISQVENSSYESISRAVIVQEESDIIPTKILPEPPKKSRSLHFLHENIETNPFFEDESADNSNCSCSSQECCSSTGSDHGYSKLDFSYENDSHLNKNKQMNGGKNTKSNGLKRSETFHYLQNESKNENRNVSTHKRNSQSKYPENKKLIIQKNNNYILQNSNNFEKELKNKNLGVKQNTKVSRSSSTKPLVNQVKSSNLPSFPTNVKMNPISYFLNKSSGFPSNVSDFTLKRHNNAGLYSGQNNLQNSSNNNYDGQITTIAPNYPQRCVGNSKEINYNGYGAKIMDFPSGLY